LPFCDTTLTVPQEEGVYYEEGLLLFARISKVLLSLLYDIHSHTHNSKQIKYLE